MKKGKAIIFTAPSGAGKTTVVTHLLEQFSYLTFSVSATTRPKREGEVNGEDYYFLSKETFITKKENGAFLEWEEVYPGRFYGTLISEVERLWSQDKHIIFDVDVKGATSLKQHFQDDALAVFIRPPSLQVLVNRLRKRGTETEAELKKRIRRVREELLYEQRFDKILVNDILEVALKEAELMVKEFLLPEIRKL